MRSFFSCLLLLALAAAPALAQNTERIANPDGIATLLQKDGRFTMLLAAVERAGLAETLETGGPFTVFAPTDEAFAALPEGALDNLGDAQLRRILSHHVLGEPVAASDAAALDEAISLADAPLAFRADNGTLYVGEAAVIEPDHRAANGIVHVINAILMPPAADAEDAMDDEDMSYDDDMTDEEAPADEQ